MRDGDAQLPLSQKHAGNPLDYGIGNTFVSMEGFGQIGLGFLRTWLHDRHQFG
jgi:hypothetical protein